MDENRSYEDELESLARNLSEKFPQGYLCAPEIQHNCTVLMALRGPNRDGLDSPLVVLEGSYVELLNFKHVYENLRAGVKQPNLSLLDVTRASVEA